jgi:hypothetical protein
VTAPTTIMASNVPAAAANNNNNSNATPAPERPAAGPTPGDGDGNEIKSPVTAQAPVSLEGAEERHPSERFSRTGERLENVSKICTRNIYSAFDNDRAMEVAWIEYGDVPTKLFDKFKDNLQSLLRLDHPNVIKYYAGWADRKKKQFVFISEVVTGDLRNLLGKRVQMGAKVRSVPWWFVSETLSDRCT